MSVPPFEPQALEAALDLQHAEWKSGRPRQVEDYLEEFPELGSNPDGVLDLIYQEFILRRRSGENVETSEFVGRFPGRGREILEQFAVCEAMGEWSLPTLPMGTDRSEPTSDSKTPDGALAIPGYEILGLLGRGAMGVVYKAREQGLGRAVALKTIDATTRARHDAVERLRIEAELIARLNHPNIIQIHAVAEHQGRPYLALEYAAGGNLERALAKGPMPALAAARLVETLARALDVAHAAGVVHRDLKPSNILMTVDGTPKIADFGLAKLLGQEVARTLSGELLGTPSYMAPEQASGKSKQVGPAADVYALGAILYRAITGRPPFEGESPVETLKLVLDSDPVPPRRQQPATPRDLETIALKCLDKDPRKRYPSARALAEDLARFQAGLTIAARPVGPVGRLARFGRRNPLLAATSGLLLATFALGTPTLFGLWLRARGDRARAEVKRDAAERSRDRALGAVNVLLGVENEDARSDEARAYRKLLVQAGLLESLALVRELEHDPRGEAQLSAAYRMMAQIQNEMGEQASAIASAQAAVAVAERALERDPKSRAARTLLADSLHRLAGIVPSQDVGQTAAARSTALYRDLRLEDPAADASEFLRQEAKNLHNSGHGHAIAGRRELAVKSFREARSLLRELAQRPNASAPDLDLDARCALYLARLLDLPSPTDPGLEAGREAVALYRKIAAQQPSTWEWTSRLALACQELGHRFLFRDRPVDAAAWFEDARRVLIDAQDRPGASISRRASIQRELAQVDHNLCVALDSDPARTHAHRREIATEALGIGDALTPIMKPVSDVFMQSYSHCSLDAAQYQELDGRAVDLDLVRRSEGLWTALAARQPGNIEAKGYQAIVRCWLAELCASRGLADEAQRWRSIWPSSVGGDAGLWYELAAELAVRCEIFGRWDLTDPAPTVARVRSELASSSVGGLRMAVAHGFRDTKRLAADQRFERIRRNAECRALLADLIVSTDPFVPAPDARSGSGK